MFMVIMCKKFIVTDSKTSNHISIPRDTYYFFYTGHSAFVLLLSEDSWWLWSDRPRLIRRTTVNFYFSWIALHDIVTFWQQFILFFFILCLYLSSEMKHGENILYMYKTCAYKNCYYLQTAKFCLFIVPLILTDQLFIGEPSM